jgi:hypothetical protein
MKRDRSLVVELKRTIEIGWYGGIGEVPPIYLVVKIYRDLRTKHRFYPTVGRRDFYSLKPSLEGQVATQIVEVEDTNYDPAEFTRTTEAAAVKAIVDRIRSMFEPDYRPRASKSKRPTRR